MGDRHFGLFSAMALAVLLSACGSGDKKDDDDKEPADAVVVDASEDAGQDAGGTPADTGGGSGAKDSGTTPPPKKVSCSDALMCLLQCSSPTGACADKCKQNLDDGVDVELKAFADCRAKECGGVGTPTKEVDCVVAKCFSAMDACFAFGSGSKTCSETAACLGACIFGDMACNAGCLALGAKGAASKAKDYKACFDSKCADGDAAEIPACATASCASEVDGCVGATKMDCSTLSACMAKCPPSKKSEPNHCEAYCSSFAESKARETWDVYVTCKTQCLLVTNPVGCVIDKCSKEQGACYTDVGTLNCQKVYDCVVKECEGIGGDPACVDKCRAQGSASAQDAYLHWEGCVLRNLKRDEAKTVKCIFPYDQNTCINYISHVFCNNKASHCFTSN